LGEGISDKPCQDAHSIADIAVSLGQLHFLQPFKPNTSCGPLQQVLHCLKTLLMQQFAGHTTL
jgi:hypothetical protein